jgi:bacteriocin-like protein
MTTKPTPTERVEQNNATEPLTETELNNVTGGSQSSDAGKVSVHDIHITRKVDKASPVFF